MQLLRKMPLVRKAGDAGAWEIATSRVGVQTSPSKTTRPNRVRHHAQVGARDLSAHRTITRTMRVLISALFIMLVNVSSDVRFVPTHPSCSRGCNWPCLSGARLSLLTLAIPAELLRLLRCVVHLCFGQARPEPRPPWQ